MRGYSRSLIPILILLTIVSLCRASEEPYQPSIAHALELERRGRMGAAIALLEPMVQSEQSALSKKDQGIAWAVLARSYQDSGNFIQAQHDYEKATQILAPMPAAASEYASALNNFGSLYRDQRQFALADKLRLRALALYRQLFDHAGIAIVLNNLAETAIQQNDRRKGSKYLEEALEEAKHASDLDWNNEAAIETTKGVLLLMGGKPETAREAFQKSIDLWQQGFGPEHYWVGWGYVLLAECGLVSGDTERAEADVTKGSAILEKALGRDNLKYAQAQIVYARILRAEGDKGRAHVLESAAQQAIQTLRHNACTGCSISAEAFR